MNYLNNNNFSSFWSDYRDTKSVDALLGIEEKKHTGRDLIALASYRRAISNFVNIVSGKSIPVEFNSKNNSYTDGEKVVLGANLNDENFDIAVGLALHEGSHVLLSDFKLLCNLSTHIPGEIYVKADTLGFNRSTAEIHIKRILNYIEDRRIDYYIFNTSPGYKGNSNRQLNALNGLRTIWNEIKLSNISRLTSSKDALSVALRVYEIILDNIKPAAISDSTKAGGESDNTTKSDAGETSSEQTSSEQTGGGNNLNDDGTEAGSLSDRQKSITETAFGKQKDFVDGNLKKTQLSKADTRNMQTLEESGATYEEVGEGVNWNSEKVKCLVVRNLTANLINSDVFSCASSYSMKSYGDPDGWCDYNFVEEGLRLGNVLGKKLKVRSEDRVTKYSRKNSGKIDKRMLAELGFGNANVFSQTLVDSYNKAYVHLSIDASGSMTGTNWNQAMTSAVAMIKACDMAGNIDVVVSIRSTHSNSNEVPLILVAYDSRKDKLTKVRTLFKALRTAGTTPEGLCFEAIAKDLIPGNLKQDSYFINYSDGAPMFSSKNYYYRGERALQHTKKQVRNMKNLGLKVMSYFISDGDYGMESFKTMYGKDAQFINPTNMMEVARTMNKKFLEK